MFVLTKEEKRVICFVMLAILVGLGVKEYRRGHTANSSGGPYGLKQSLGNKQKRNRVRTIPRSLQRVLINRIEDKSTLGQPLERLIHELPAITSILLPRDDEMRSVRWRSLRCPNDAFSFSNTNSRIYCYFPPLA